MIMSKARGSAIESIEIFFLSSFILGFDMVEKCLQYGCSSEDISGPTKGGCWTSIGNGSKHLQLSNLLLFYKPEQEGDFKEPDIVAVWRVGVAVCQGIQHVL